MMNGVAGALIASVVSGGIASGADNLIVNGSFEATPINGAWQLFDTLPGWSLMSGPAIEVQRGVGGWLAADGEQWIELDADENGPGGGSFSGEEGSSFIMQDLETSIGQLYLLTLAFSPRPGVADNHLVIEWDGDVIAEATASGVGRSTTTWDTISVLIEADRALSTLSLGDVGTNDTLGTMIDDVRVIAVPGPATLALVGLLPMLRTSRRRR